MSVLPVDKNLYMRLLRHIDVPYDTRLSTFDNQKRKTKKPDIPPKCSNLTTNHK